MISWTLLLPLLAHDHVVMQEGDTVESVAAELGMSAEEVRARNGLAPGVTLKPGDVLLLPRHGPAGEAVLIHSVGQGSVEVPGQPPAPLRAPMRLPEGSRVCTGPLGYASVRLSADAETDAHDDVHLLPETCVVIESLTAQSGERSSLISLGQGSLTMQHSEQDSEGQLTVRTHSAVATSEAGDQRLHVDSDGTRAEAVSGSMELYGAGQQRSLVAGQGAEVAMGAAPSNAVDLLRAGPVLSPLDDEVLRIASFIWTPLDRALGYQVEFSLDSAFTEVVLVDDVPLPRWDPELLLLPYQALGLWFRVTPYDRSGYLGVPSPAVHLRFPPGSGQ